MIRLPLKLVVSFSLLTVCLTTAAQPMQWGGPQTWAFSPERDTFSKASLLDLRELNEKVAGESGFVGSNAHGDFVRGDGKPIRFWAVNTGVAMNTGTARPLWPQGVPDLDRHARFLAKRGVNMVRLHQQISPALEKNPKALMTDINEAERDAIWRTVAAMRKQGIYTTLSPYWAIPMKFSPAWPLPGGGRQSGAGLLFFDETLQKAYKVWLKKLLTETNPYTGIALAQDPSLAVFQLQNEDSLLFWTFNGIQGEQRLALEQRYNAFLLKKYGSHQALHAAWRGAGEKSDAPDQGRLTLLNLWELTQSPKRLPLLGNVLGDVTDILGGKATRRTDQTEFLSRVMSDFNQSMVKYLREELGMKQLVNAGNWKTASSVHLNDAERWSYTATQVDAANVYTGGIHKGPHEGWAIVNGDKFTNESVLNNPRLLPINLKQTAGRPMLLTEGSWVMPNRYAAEGPFLIAAYSSLNGVDGYYWFATGDEGWSAPQSANGYMASQSKWIFATPEMLGSFPAAALAYRLGYISRGTPVVTENRSLQDIWQRKTPVITEATSFDPNRDTGDIAKHSSIQTGVSADAFLVGPVLVDFEKDPSKSLLVPFQKQLDSGRITSNTGELVMNATQAYATIDAPRVQGVAAHFAKARMHQLTDIRFASGNAYGAAMAVSMDGAPLKSSRRILLQYATQSRPTGWQESAVSISLEDGQTTSGFQVDSFGRAPWQIIKAELEITVKNPGLQNATVLDMNGMVIKKIPLNRTALSVSLKFPQNAMYVILQ